MAREEFERVITTQFLSRAQENLPILSALSRHIDRRVTIFTVGSGFSDEVYSVERGFQESGVAEVAFVDALLIRFTHHRDASS